MKECSCGDRQRRTKKSHIDHVNRLLISFPLPLIFFFLSARGFEVKHLRRRNRFSHFRYLFVNRLDSSPQQDRASQAYGGGEQRCYATEKCKVCSFVLHGVSVLILKEEDCWGGCNLGSSFPTPKEICNGFDKFVIGQESQKKAESLEPISREREGVQQALLKMRGRKNTKFAVLSKHPIVFLSQIPEEGTGDEEAVEGQGRRGCGAKILRGEGALSRLLSETKPNDSPQSSKDGSDGETEVEAENPSVVAANM